MAKAVAPEPRAVVFQDEELPQLWSSTSRQNAVDPLNQHNLQLEGLELEMALSKLELDGVIGVPKLFCWQRCERQGRPSAPNGGTISPT
jgi:hypothetical protein